MARLLRILAITLITAGLVLLADIGITLAYEEPISSVHAAIQQRQAESELEETEARYAATAAAGRGLTRRGRERRIAKLARRFGRRVGEGEAIGRIRAAEIGLDTVVVQGTDTASLRIGPGHFSETSFPGEDGTVGIAGHRTTDGAPFRHADSLERGDRIVLEMPYATFAYRVQGTEIVDPSEIGVVRDVGYERLVLSSCHPLYSASQRLIVYARMVSETPGAQGRS
ncbi:MAG: class E sortase [Solirubrobacterales bacterium]|nr:class E sortase [Solirubrobacterales bacterium]